MNKTANIFSILLLASVSTTRPIPENVAHALTAGTALTAGLGLKYGLGASWLLAIPGGALGGGLGHYFWHRFTPAGRMKRAISALNTVKANALTTTVFEHEDKAMEAVQEMYVSSEWPLITAFNDLTSLLIEAQSAIDLAQASASEDSLFAHKAKNVVTEAKDMVDNITKAVKTIRTNKEYIAQLDQYKKEQQHKEKLAVQQSMANAQWHSAHAQWHKAHSPKVVVHHNAAAPVI